MTLEIGRVCKKIVGREAGKTCVILSESKDHLVLIDGEVKRKNCNKGHLEPLSLKVDLKEGASTKDVLLALQNAGLKVVGRKTETKKKTSEKPKKQRKSDNKKEEVKEEKTKKEKKKSDKK
jgi:large subunit ribosomal protein L14e